MAAQEYEQDGGEEGIKESSDQETVEVLEFELDTDGFCVEIGYIAEIVSDLVGRWIAQVDAVVCNRIGFVEVFETQP